MRFVLAAGTTRTAEIPGISAAGADPRAMVHTPAADAEIVEYGRTVRSPVVPVSPEGCPTPAVVTRAVRELVGFETIVVDGGLDAPTGAPTVEVGASPGGDVRERDPVPCARVVFESARRFAAALPDEEIYVAETIPGGTTTALGVLTALGEEFSVSSSLPDNPIQLKQAVVEEALASDGLDPGDAVGAPTDALRAVGDPVLATVAGLARGALDAGIDVTLSGGTQMVAAAALVRHAGVERPLSLATTSFLAGDEDASIERAAAAVDVDLTVTGLPFDASDHAALSGYANGVAKEGAGMGGALAIAAAAGVSSERLHDRINAVYHRLSENDAP